MVQTKIRTRRGFKILGAATGATFALMVAAGCNDPAPEQEQQQEQEEGGDQQDGGDQQNGEQEEGGEQEGEG